MPIPMLMPMPVPMLIPKPSVLHQPQKLLPLGPYGVHMELPQPQKLLPLGPYGVRARPSVHPLRQERILWRERILQRENPITSAKPYKYKSNTPKYKSNITHISPIPIKCSWGGSQPLGEPTAWSLYLIYFLDGTCCKKIKNMCEPPRGTCILS